MPEAESKRRNLSPEATSRKRAYDKEYINKNIVMKSLSFNENDPEDMEIFYWIQSKGKRNGTKYIKDLIREDMKKSGE